MVLVGGIALYFLSKIFLAILRPFFLAKNIDEIDTFYNKIKKMFEKEYSEAIEFYKRWDSGDGASKKLHSEEEMKAHVDHAKVAMDHEQEVYYKFVRLKERFIQKPKELMDVIMIYKRYLKDKLAQHTESQIYSTALINGAMSLSEFEESAKEKRIILEEIERKLDSFLNVNS